MSADKVIVQLFPAELRWELICANPREVSHGGELTEMRDEPLQPIHARASNGFLNTFFVRVEPETASRTRTFRVFHTLSADPEEDFYEARVVRTSSGTAYTEVLSAHPAWAQRAGIPAALLPFIRRTMGVEITSPPPHAGLIPVDVLDAWRELQEQGLASYHAEDRMFRLEVD